MYIPRVRYAHNTRGNGKAAPGLADKNKSIRMLRSRLGSESPSERSSVGCTSMMIQEGPSNLESFGA